MRKLTDSLNRKDGLRKGNFSGKEDET